jgi:hypothetical protein
MLRTWRAHRRSHSVCVTRFENRHCTREKLLKTQLQTFVTLYLRIAGRYIALPVHDGPSVLLAYPNNSVPIVMPPVDNTVNPLNV